MSSGVHGPGGGLGAQSVPLTSRACGPDGGLSPLASSAPADGEARPVLPGDSTGQCQRLAIGPGLALSVPLPAPLPAAWASFLISTPGGWAQGWLRGGLAVSDRPAPAGPPGRGQPGGDTTELSSAPPPSLPAKPRSGHPCGKRVRASPGPLVEKLTSREASLWAPGDCVLPRPSSEQEAAPSRECDAVLSEQPEAVHAPGRCTFT